MGWNHQPVDHFEWDPFWGEDNCSHMFVWGNNNYLLSIFCLGKKCVFLHFCCLGKRIVDMILFRENDCWQHFYIVGKGNFTAGIMKKMYLCHWMGKFPGKIHMDTLKNIHTAKARDTVHLFSAGVIEWDAFWGDQTWCKGMVIVRDVPCSSAMSGLVIWWSLLIEISNEHFPNATVYFGVVL